VRGARYALLSLGGGVMTTGPRRRRSDGKRQGSDSDAVQYSAMRCRPRWAQAVPLKLRRGTDYLFVVGMWAWKVDMDRVSPAKRLLPVPGSRVRPTVQTTAGPKTNSTR
jgi:hypothetical protein